MPKLGQKISKAQFPPYFRQTFSRYGSPEITLYEVFRDISSWYKQKQFDSKKQARVTITVDFS